MYQPCLSLFYRFVCDWRRWQDFDCVASALKWKKNLWPWLLQWICGRENILFRNIWLHLVASWEFSVQPWYFVVMLCYVIDLFEQVEVLPAIQLVWTCYTHPPMYSQRTATTPGTSSFYSSRIVCGFFNVPQRTINEHGRYLWDGVYGL